MKRVSARSVRIMILLGMLLTSFALYAAANAGPSLLLGGLLSVLLLFILLAMIAG
jgi:hypothetical protein